MTKQKILILGGGFAGVEAAIKAMKAGFEVILVSNREYIFIRPISIWIPTGEIPFEKTIMPLSDLAKKWKFEFLKGALSKIDPENNTATVDEKEIGYDYLILAVGAGKGRPKGVEHTLSICGEPDEPDKIKERLNELIKKGSGKIAFGFGGNPKDPSAVRGGPVFEILFNVDNMLRSKKLREKFELIFFAPMEKPGQKMGEKALSMMDVWFKKLDISRNVGKKIKEFDSEGVHLEGGQQIKSDLIIFTPGGVGHPVVKESGLPLSEAGFIKIDKACRVQGKENIYAVGDVAALEGPKWAAKQGHLAESMAQIAVRDIESVCKTNTRTDASYVDHISIMCLMDSGNGAAFVRRTNEKSSAIPMPIVGHWMKKGWGTYWKLSKMGKIPRIPGM